MRETYSGPTRLLSGSRKTIMDTETPYQGNLRNTHYGWLGRNLIIFLQRVGFSDAKYCIGLISAHGDKGYGYKRDWEEAGIPYEQGMAVYMLTYLSPWSKTVRETDAGWVDPCQWVVEHHNKYKELFEGLE